MEDGRCAVSVLHVGHAGLGLSSPEHGQRGHAVAIPRLGFNEGPDQRIHLNATEVASTLLT